MHTVVQALHFWMRPRLLVVLGVLLGLAISIAEAHLFDTVNVHIRGPGNTGAFIIFDPSGCSALITATVADANIATVAPTGPIDAVVLAFTVTAATSGPDTTTILVKWVGEDFPELPCNEQEEQTITVTIEAPALSAANTNNVGIASRDPINTFTGELFALQPPELVLGGPLPVVFQRYYSSFVQREGNITSSLGSNWIHNFHWELHDFGNVIEVMTPRGRVIRFVDADTSITEGAWILTGKTDIPFQLVRRGVEFLLGDPRSRRLYTFDEATGRLLRIEDGKGNVHTLTSSGGNLVEVADGLGRLLTFGYSAGKLISVSDGTRTVAFAYTGDDLTTVTDPAGNTTTYGYAPGGLLTAQTLPNGNTLFTQTYDAQGRIITQTDAEANTHAFAYDDMTGITTLTDPLGNVQRHTHTATGELIAHEDTTAQVFGYAYNGDGQRTAMTDRLGNQTSFTYHAASGQLASRTNPEGATTSFSYAARLLTGITLYDLVGAVYADATTESFTYDAVGNLLSRIDRGGNTWSFTYNGRGQVLTMTNPAGGVLTYSYNGAGTLATVTDGAGNLTTFAYDGLRRLTQIIHADGSTRDFTYDALDNRLTVADERGNPTTMAYDGNSNLIGITDAMGNSTLLAYDGLDRVVAVTDPLGNTATRSYDPLERPAAFTDRNDSLLTLGYDPRGRLTTMTDAAGQVWSNTYDAEGTIATTNDPSANTRRFVPDGVGRLTRITSPLGNVIQKTYDNLGRITARQNPLGEVTTHTYDALGLPAGVALPGSLITATYGRNTLGQVASVTDPNGNVWQRAYDTLGRLTSDTDPLGNVATLTYDGRNRVLQAALPGGSLDFTYDATGNITRRLYADGTDLTYSYDALNRLTSANGVVLTYDANSRIVDSNGLGMTRGAEGHLASLTLAPGKVVTYGYDVRNLLTQVTDWLGGTTSLAYDDAGRLITVTRPNGLVTTYSYDADGRIVGITEGGLSSIALARDGNDQVTAVNRSVPQTASVSLSSAVTLLYDAASQVASFIYDSTGRLVDDGVRTYTWDLASRLTSYNAGGNVVSFTYDAQGNRLARTEGGITRDYVWNYALGLPSINVERQGGSDRRYYIYTPGGVLLYSLEVSDNSRRFYHFDEMGNSLFLSDDGGAVIVSYAYSPYGVLLASSGAVENLLTWQGMYGVLQEGPGGLYYMRARYYDSNTGRFLSRDPVRSVDPQAINPYQYARGNPVLYIDPMGLEFVVQSGPGGYNCHGYTLFGGEQEAEQEAVDQILQSDYMPVDKADAQPGDIIVYDFPLNSHTGIVVDVDANGVQVISKFGSTGDLKAHRPGDFGSATDADWRIFRRKGLRISKPTQEEIDRLRRRLRRTCGGSPGGPDARRTAGRLGKLLQDLNYHGGGRVLETPDDERRLDSTLFNPAGQLFQGGSGF